MQAPRRFLKVGLSLLAALFFLWLAFRGVDFGDLWSRIGEVRFGWVFPFVMVLLGSHYLRAERWRLLLSEEEKMPTRSTLFTGVMIGYMMNYVLPRLGEISRPLYVARQEGISSGSLFGTIVLERAIDLVSLVLFLLIVSIGFVNDQDVNRIFGTGDWAVNLYLLIPILILILFLGSWGLYRGLKYLSERSGLEHPLLVRAVNFGKHFWKGLSAIRHVPHWPLFILYTIGIWTGFILMAYLPFQMLDLHTLYGLHFIEAMVITVISAVGITVPTPGGIGSYHFFVQQSLWILYDVPLVSGLTYATVTHAISMITVFIAGTLQLWFNKYYTLRTKSVR